MTDEPELTEAESISDAEEPILAIPLQRRCSQVSPARECFSVAVRIGLKFESTERAPGSLKWLLLNGVLHQDEGPDSFIEINEIGTGLLLQRQLVCRYNLELAVMPGTVTLYINSNLVGSGDDRLENRKFAKSGPRRQDGFDRLDGRGRQCQGQTPSACAYRGVPRNISRR